MKQVYISAIFALLTLPVPASALGLAGTIQDGGYKNATPTDERVKFGDSETIVQRQNFFVPASYGKLLTITGTSDRAVLWYEDENGRLRNVLVNSGELMIIQRSNETPRNR